MKKIFFLLLMVSTITSFNLLSAQKSSKGEYYQLTIYRYSTAEQEKMLDDYLENFLIPSLHKKGSKTIGAFKALANDTAAIKSLYLLMPVKSLNEIGKIHKSLAADKGLENSPYSNAAYNAAAYNRMEVILLKAFHLAPKLKTPVLKSLKSERVYELRSYESPSEKTFRNKVHMFNEGNEIGIFRRLNFNAIFYGEVIAGSRMPNLMYLTSFENMEDRKAHWKSFGSDPEWNKLSGMQEYKHNVSKIDITFLRPTDYSDF